MVHAKKSLGQNFLMHARIAERIVLVAELQPDTTVFEVGPGTGMLTRELVKKVKKVIALEADASLVAELQATFADEIREGRLELIHGDIRDMYHNSRYSVNEGTFENGAENMWDRLPKGYVLVANIPYYLTGEIFRLFLAADNQPHSMTLLVQKEVAERVARSKKESIFSLSVKAYGTPHYEFTVPRGAFTPAPKVDSAVLTVRDISRRRFTSRAHEERFFSLLHAGFAHKRKLLKNNLSNLVPEKMLRDSGVYEGARAEDLPLLVWLGLASIHSS
ncbi:MAG: 16S rRNA (adenine(1518)-N(6)/adenine(1519)-N(6))-dimethyltransferase RsmA [Patescibacteria group bacterium]